MGIILERERTKAKAKRATQRLRELEKQGLAKSSAAYRFVEKESYDSKFIDKTKKGEIKFTGKIGKMSNTDLQDYNEMLDKFLNAKTSKARETKQALDKAYQSFIDNPENENMANISREDWEEAWTDDLFKRVNEKFGYEETFRIINEENKITNNKLTVTDIKEIIENIDIENSTLEQFNQSYDELKQHRTSTTLTKGTILT